MLKISKKYGLILSLIFSFVPLSKELLAQASLPVPLVQLSNGDYTFTEWANTNAAGTYPASMIFHYVPTNQTAPFYTEGNLNYDCGYNKTSRPRINGLGANGFSFITTSSSQYNNCTSGTATNRFMGAAVLGLDFTGVTNATITWTGGTVVAGDGTPTPREWRIRLQYRIGNTGNYSDVPGADEYISNIAGHSSVMGPVSLPAACANQPEVYVRWIYYESAANNGGSRPELRVDEILVTQGSFSTPPVLNPDVTANNVDNDIEITFVDDPAWRAAVTAVKIGGIALNGSDYTLTAGLLTLHPSAGNPLLTTAGTKVVVVEATGYSAASVTQVINAGDPVAANCTATINTPLAINSTRTVTVTAKDQYNNNVPNYNFVVDVVKTDNNATTNEQYVIDGNPYTTSVSDVPLENATGSNGEVTFTITIPGLVDNNDGVSVQVQLANGNTDVGTAFSFINLVPEIGLSGSDPSSLLFYRNMTNNIIYRIKIDVTNNSTQLTDLSVQLAGSYTQNDISANGVKLWSSPSSTWGGQTLVASQSSTSTGSGETITFSGLSITLNPGTLYLFVTVDVASNAVLGNNIQMNQPQPVNFIFSAGAIINSTFTPGNMHTILGDPQLSEVILPQFIQGLNGTNNSRIPFVCRLTLSNLQPNATYRYINQAVEGTDGPTVGGAGNVIFVNADNSFTRATNTSFSVTGQYGEFTTDASGSFTGWFITEPTGNARFTPGKELYMRIRLNDGAGGTTASWYLTTSSSFQVINFGSNNTANEATGVYGPSLTTAKNFIFLYDNSNGIGRPLSGTFVESDGTSGGTSYPLYYQNNVDGQNGYWGSIIPNNNSNGVLRLEYRYLINGNIHYAVTDNDGNWNGSNTVNPTNGLNALLIEPDANKYLDVRVYLEGPFDGTGMTTDLQQNGIIPLNQPYNTAPWNYSGTESVASVPANIVDWVLVELRDADIPDNATPATTLAGWPKAYFLRNDG
ncbi:MAG: hemoblobin-interacting domain-containing protein, partial [Bacteroidales bacterium]